MLSFHLGIDTQGTVASSTRLPDPLGSLLIQADRCSVRQTGFIDGKLAGSLVLRLLPAAAHFLPRRFLPALDIPQRDGTRSCLQRTLLRIPARPALSKSGGTTFR